MPTILFIKGWRFFFYSDEGNEPIHIHCTKAGKRCKYWLNDDEYNIVEAYALNMNPAEKRFVKKIIFEYFDYIIEQWNNYHRG